MLTECVYMCRQKEGEKGRYGSPDKQGQVT